MQLSEPLIVACLSFILVVTVLSVLLISMRRLGIRLDNWFFNAIPLRKVGVEFVSYYLNVALIWLLGISLLVANDLINLVILIIAATLVPIGTGLAAIRRWKKLNEKGFTLFKKRR